MKQKISKFLKRIMLISTSIIILIAITGFFYIRNGKFGKAPEGLRLEKIKKSTNYRDGKFQNFNHTPEITEGYNYFEITYQFLFKKDPRKIPTDSIPSVKTDLLNLPAEKDILVWFGHSSYFMQLDGKKFLIDPVLSGNASPIAGSNKAFPGTERYSVADLPAIDYLLITHDHYDHLDYETILLLKEKTKKVICGLGVGSHFEYWGYKPEVIVEKDWHETIDLDFGFVIHTTPARHFSGRSLNRNNTQWLSFVLETPTSKIYIGGDSGYDTHFAEIGKKFGPFDLAIVENGQYDIKWKYIHLLPSEVLKAASDLRAKKLFPVHSSKFGMANHAWDEPLKMLSELNKAVNMPLATPMIGEVLNLKDSTQVFSKWWEGIK
jgi:L-ascorbate metabolism protein UlaG (beta-lactamase superfamily)